MDADRETRRHETATGPPEFSPDRKRRGDVSPYGAFTASLDSSGCVRLEGELGADSVSALRAILEQAFFTPGNVIVDVGDLSFISTRAITELLRFQLIATSQHRQILLVELAPQVERVIDLLDLRHLLASPYAREADTSVE